MNNDDTLSRIEAKLDVIVALMLDRHLREYPELGRTRATRIENVLDDAGLSGAEIAGLLGKSRQAVSQNLAKSAKN